MGVDELVMNTPRVDLWKPLESRELNAGMCSRLGSKHGNRAASSHETEIVMVPNKTDDKVVTGRPQRRQNCNALTTTVDTSSVCAQRKRGQVLHSLLGEKGLSLTGKLGAFFDWYSSPVDYRFLVLGHTI
jgi:hypothetical protein